MKISRVDRESASQARGIVIVIDVLRAFSVAGYAFAGGARSFWLVRTWEEALALREREPGALVGGEIGGRLIPGFDFNNSPSQMAMRDVRDRLLIQRTGAGTQGAVAANGADVVLLCALTNASATAIYAHQLATQTGAEITLFPTARIETNTSRTEDDICADYVEALLQGQSDGREILSQGLAYLAEIGRFAHWQKGDPDLPAADIPAILEVNRFPFAMVGSRQLWHEITYIEVQRVDVNNT